MAISPLWDIKHIFYIQFYPLAGSPGGLEPISAAFQVRDEEGSGASEILIEGTKASQENGAQKHHSR